MKARWIRSLATALAAVALAASGPPAKKDPAPTPKPPAPQGPVNAKCPVKDEPVDSAITVEHQGKLVAFCCESCKEEFAVDPAKFPIKPEK